MTTARSLNLLALKLVCVLAMSGIATQPFAQGSNFDQVAERVGFADATSFRKAFRKWTGHSPTDYRRAGFDRAPA